LNKPAVVVGFERILAGVVQIDSGRDIKSLLDETVRKTADAAK
jgi:hypothetical protein